MYQYLIYFIVTLIIYSTYEPIKIETSSAAESFFSQALLVALFAIACQWVYLSIERALRQDKISENEAHKRYAAWNTRFSILAIVMFAIHLYVFNLKYYLREIPLFQSFSSLDALAGLSVFVLYLVIQWIFAYPLARRFFLGEVDRFRYVTNRLRLALSVLFPWFVITLLFDLAERTSLPFFAGMSPFVREVILFVTFLSITMLFAPLFMKFFWGLTPLPAGPQRVMIEKVCQRLNLSYRDIVSWPTFEGEMVTAGIMGLVGRLRYLMISPTLLKILDAEEVESVVGHEIGHIRKHHLVFYVLFLLGYLVFVYPTFDVIYLLTLSSETVYELVSMAPDYQLTILSIILTAPILLLFIIYFRFIFGYFIRNFERQADFFSMKALGKAEPLIGALEKIGYYSGNIRDVPSWHHFSIAQRVTALRRGEENPGVLVRHDRKVRNFLIVYFLAVVMMGYAGYSAAFSDVSRQLAMRAVKKVLIRQTQENPHDMKSLATLATLLYEDGEYKEAEQGYLRVLETNPNNAEVLNNLAWLYATCPDESFRKPEEALSLALRAAELQPVAHILDTLAESYFVTGRYDEAVETIKKALALKPDNVEYYREQLNKFLKAKEERLKETPNKESGAG